MDKGMMWVSQAHLQTNALGESLFRHAVPASSAGYRRKSYRLADRAWIGLFVGYRPAFSA
jgi:hypothetical protein